MSAYIFGLDISVSRINRNTPFGNLPEQGIVAPVQAKAVRE